MCFTGTDHFIDCYKHSRMANNKFKSFLAATDSCSNTGWLPIFCNWFPFFRILRQNFVRISDFPASCHMPPNNFKFIEDTPEVLGSNLARKICYHQINFLEVFLSLSKIYSLFQRSQIIAHFTFVFQRADSVLKSANNECL